jgi:hypothetical protein
MGFLGADAMLFALAWIVLIILIVCTTAVIVFLAMLPGMIGMIAKKRKHPWEHAVTIAGWVTMFFGFRALATSAGLGLCRCADAP